MSASALRRSRGPAPPLARGGDRRLNAPGLVPSACHPGVEFRGAITGEDEVGMAVDETGEDASARGIDPRVSSRGILTCSDPGHPPVAADDQRGIGNIAQRRSVSVLG